VEDFDYVKSNLSEFCVCTGGGLGLTAEFGLRPGATTALVDGPRTALWQLEAEQPHPDLGGGLLCRLHMPHPVARERLPDVLQELNSGPPPRPTHPLAWWRQFVFAEESDTLPKADAIQCIELILAELGISTSGRAINFPGATVTVGDFQSALTQLTGGELGWKTLTELYRRQFQHGRTDH